MENNMFIINRDSIELEKKILICCDLDRTVIPNGHQPESPEARPLFRFLAGMSGLYLAYVTGRRKELIHDAITDFYLPVPDFAVGDVGTTIYSIENGSWTEIKEWDQAIAHDWKGMSADRLREIFEDLSDLVLQEEVQQNRRKLSYYVDETSLTDELIERMERRIKGEGLKATIIRSIDEARHIGLIDVIPESATKYHGVRFLMERFGFPEKQTLFAGDSGNDIPALTSGLQAVLVNNARDEVKEQAGTMVTERGLGDMLYVAAGDFLGMNGNYSAGVLEGIVHYYPEFSDIFRDFIDGTRGRSTHIDERSIQG